MSTGLITLKVRAVLQEFKQTIVIEEVQKCISWHFLRMVNCLYFPYNPCPCFVTIWWWCKLVSIFRLVHPKSTPKVVVGLVVLSLKPAGVCFGLPRKGQSKNRSSNPMRLHAKFFTYNWQAPSVKNHMNTSQFTKYSSCVLEQQFLCHMRRCWPASLRTLLTARNKFG